MHYLTIDTKTITPTKVNDFKEEVFVIGNTKFLIFVKT